MAGSAASVAVIAVIAVIAFGGSGDASRGEGGVGAPATTLASPPAAPPATSPVTAPTVGTSPVAPPVAPPSPAPPPAAPPPDATPPPPSRPNAPGGLGTSLELLVRAAGSGELGSEGPVIILRTVRFQRALADGSSGEGEARDLRDQLTQIVRAGVLVSPNDQIVLVAVRELREYLDSIGGSQEPEPNAPSEEPERPRNGGTTTTDIPTPTSGGG